MYFSKINIPLISAFGKHNPHWNRGNGHGIWHGWKFWIWLSVIIYYEYIKTNNVYRPGASQLFFFWNKHSSSYLFLDIREYHSSSYHKISFSFISFSLKYIVFFSYRDQLSIRCTLFAVADLCTVNRQLIS